ncbi:MAG: DUF2961 domain-containing protein [Chloroflexi bacterium]|nr:DUF2961 domain-containing protein [Chloroflexota bacterium]
MFYADPARLVAGSRTLRHSSWDRSGRNQDYLILAPGQTVTLLDEQGPGRINHLYWTTINGSRFQYRQLVLRAWWDGEASPSVEVPLGDLFGVPHSTPVPLQSLAAVINPGDSRVVSWGHNLYLPMPWASSARIELSYDELPGLSGDNMAFWYHVDMERFTQPLPSDVARFHAQWQRENPTTPKAGTEPNASGWNGTNLNGAENYVALQAQGRGQMVGLHLQVDNLGGGWYGEGDDMVFVDAAETPDFSEKSGVLTSGVSTSQWPPVYHGTGTEEIFGGGAGPNHPYHGPYTGFHMVENPDYAGKSAMYRWYLADPIRFERSIKWTIEHGHDNNFSNDYTSVAYWYQTEPHAPFPALLDVLGRLPRHPPAVLVVEAARVRAMRHMNEVQSTQPPPPFEVFLDLFLKLGAGCRALVAGRPDEALAAFTSIEQYSSQQ